MRLMYLLVLASGSILLLFRSRIDVYMAAYGAAAIYFMPAFYGRDQFNEDLHGKVYAVMVVVLVAIVAGALHRDWPRRRLSPTVLLERDPGITSIVILGSAILLTGICLVSGGFSVFRADRGGQLPGQLYIVWRLSSALCLLYGIITRARRLSVVGALLTILFFLAGDRTNVALLAVAFVLLYGQAHRFDLRAIRLRHIALFSVLALGVVFGKLVLNAFTAVAFQGDSTTARQLLSTEAFRRQLLNAEPFTTQAILNKVLIVDDRLEPGYLVGSVLHFSPSPGAFGSNTNHYNDHVQNEVFPAATYGLANNYWAEAISTGGWPMLAVFIAVFLAGLRLFDYLLRSQSPLVKPAALYGSSLFAFYIHRNSLFTIIAYERHLFYYTVVVVIVIALIDGARRRKRVPQRVLSQ